VLQTGSLRPPQQVRACPQSNQRRCAVSSRAAGCRASPALYGWRGVAIQSLAWASSMMNPGVHDDDAPASPAMMPSRCDPDDGHAQLVTQALDQFNDLRLNGHVERGVGSSAMSNWACKTAPSNHHTLAHPAGKLVRVVVEAGRCLRDADHVNNSAARSRTAACSCPCAIPAPR